MQISILGCGWLGLPLAQTLVRQGHTIKGSTTRPEKRATLEEAGIASYLLRFDPEINEDYQPDFFDSELLLVNFPPKRDERVTEVYPRQVASLLRTLENSPVKKLLFVSSTSVYPNVNRAVQEEDAGGEVKASGQALLMAERMVREAPGIRATVLRFCGLFGPDRHPGRFLAGKTLDGSGQTPVNMIHLDDCIGIIVRVIEQDVWGETFNACADEHPAKEDFYRAAAQRRGFEPPCFTAKEKDRYKTVDSTKLKETLRYQFDYSNPTDGIER